MPFAKVNIEATIVSPAVPTKGRKQDANGVWQDGPTRYQYAYTHLSTDGVLAGAFTCDSKDLKIGETYMVPLRVELKNVNIQVDHGYPLVPSVKVPLNPLKDKAV